MHVENECYRNSSLVFCFFLGVNRYQIKGGGKGPSRW